MLAEAASFTGLELPWSGSLEQLNKSWVTAAGRAHAFTCAKCRECQKLAASRSTPDGPVMEDGQVRHVPAGLARHHVTRDVASHMASHKKCGGHMPAGQQ